MLNLKVKNVLAVIVNKLLMPHLTLICLPLNKDSSSAMAVLTDSLSENSI